MRIALLTALLASTLFAQSTPPKQTDPLWTVVLGFKTKDGLEPQCRLYISVNARTEGESAIRAYTYIKEKLSAGAEGQLEFIEAQQRADGK